MIKISKGESKSKYKSGEERERERNEVSSWMSMQPNL